MEALKTNLQRLTAAISDLAKAKRGLEIAEAAFNEEDGLECELVADLHNAEEFMDSSKHDVFRFSKLINEAV